MMQNEMKRVAQKLGGTFLPSESVVKTQKELILENVILYFPIIFTKANF